MKQTAAGTPCTGFKPSAANNMNGFCFQQVGLERFASAQSTPPNDTVDPSLNIDPTRAGVEPDIAFTGTDDKVVWTTHDRKLPLTPRDTEWLSTRFQTAATHLAPLYRRMELHASVVQSRPHSSLRAAATLDRLRHACDGHGPRCLDGERPQRSCPHGRRRAKSAQHHTRVVGTL